MKISEAYNAWSASYDTVANSTRDLEQKATQTIFKSKHFKSVLELGCGTGKNTHFWASISDHVTAVDFSEGMLAVAKTKVVKPNVEFLTLDISEKWDFGKGEFDLIACSLTLEHLDDIQSVFEQAAFSLQKGGVFYICELHPDKHKSGKGHPRFIFENKTVYIKTHLHSSSDILQIAKKHLFKLIKISDWHTENNDYPGIISYVFKKS